MDGAYAFRCISVSKLSPPAKPGAEQKGNAGYKRLQIKSFYDCYYIVSSGPANFRVTDTRDQSGDLFGAVSPKSDQPPSGDDAIIPWFFCMSTRRFS